MPVDDPISVFTDDPNSLLRLRAELNHVPCLRWAGLRWSRVHRNAIQVLLAFDPSRREDFGEEWVSHLRGRLCAAAGRPVDVQPIAFNSMSQWREREGVQSLLSPDEFEYTPGTGPAVSDAELAEMRERHANDLSRMRENATQALALLGE